MDWLPSGKTAAVCFSVDDVHPSRSTDAYEAGGDLERGRLGLLQALLERHPFLKATVFVTPDWRPIQLVRSRRLASLPLVRDFVYHVDLNPPGRLRIDRFPEFVAYLNSLDRVEVALHGLHHVHPGRRLAVEFQNQSTAACRASLERGLAIFRSAALDHVPGFAPPGWNLPDALIRALADLDFRFVCSARDIETPISPDATNRMSGIPDISIVRPQLIGDGRLLHVPVNFQATSLVERADAIITCGGIVSVKAHIFKEGGGFRLKDGLDGAYLGILDALFSRLESDHGDSLWWTSMSEIADRIFNTCPASDSQLAEGRTAVPRETAYVRRFEGSALAASSPEREAHAS